jgi:aminoglycoside N3'-acetyltransferase
VNSNKYNEIIAPDRICADLIKLGVEKGDSLLVTSSLKAIGWLVQGPETLLRGLLDAVGPAGAIYGESFTPAFPLPLSVAHRTSIFHSSTPPITGRFNEYLVAHPAAFRSAHPTSSFVGIGSGVRELLKDHLPGSMGFEPVAGLARLPRAWFLSLGTLEIGVPTVHVAQNRLGFKTRYHKKYGVNYRASDGSTKLYTRDYVGGCSRGFTKFYPHYREAGAMHEGRVGKAPSALIHLKTALDIDTRLLEADPGFFFCDQPDCYQCRAGWEHSPNSWLSFQFIKLRQRLFKRKI